MDEPAVYPAFHVLSGLARGRAAALLAQLAARSSEPRKMAALPWREGPRVVLWVANLTAKPLSVRMTSQLRVSVLDVAGLEQAATSLHALDSLRRPLERPELKLDAYPIARVEAESARGS